jgi:hypothetical protein
VGAALIYLRHNLVQELLGALVHASQSTISRVISTIVPIVEKVTAAEIPTAEEAAETVRGRVALLDGSLAPCWSWAGHRELWAGKHRTTGHNFQVVTIEDGSVAYVSDALPGCAHDMRALEETGVAKVLEGAGGVIADKGYQGSGYVTPAKKPQGGELLLREERYNQQVASMRAPVERAVANIKVWRILFTDYRRPLATWKSAFRAAIGLYFYSMA